MPLLDNYQVSKDRIFEWTRWIYTFLRNAIHKAAFALDLVDEQWLLDRLRIEVKIAYPAVATMPMGDLHMGTLVRKGTKTEKSPIEGKSQRVVVKALRFVAGQESPSYHTAKVEITRKLVRECFAWSLLRHKNICPFRGLDRQDEFELPVLVSAFTPYQCIEYVNDHPESKMAVLRGVASGIKYLHDNCIVHGDIKPDNIRIDSEGRAQIINFRSGELESILGLRTDQRSQISPRFCAPELLRLALTQSDVKPTFKSDVFSFSMAMLQILDSREGSLSLPYKHFNSEFKLWTKLTQSVETVERPKLGMYENVPNAAQELLKRFWEEDPKHRPSMSMVVRELNLLAS